MSSPDTIINIIIAAASWCGAIVSLVFAILTYRFSKRQILRLEPKIKLEIIRSHLYNDVNSNTAIFAFNLAISNLSDNDNSIKKIWLHIKHKRKNVPLDFGLEHNHSILIDGRNPFDLPIKIEAHSCISGWALFSVTRDRIIKMNIRTYELSIIDVHNNDIKAHEDIQYEEILNER